MFIGFVKFEIKQWFSAYQDQFCEWFSLYRLPTETARKSFLDHFLKEAALSVSLELASRTCSMPWQDFASHVKYYPNSQTFGHFKTAEGKTS